MNKLIEKSKIKVLNDIINKLKNSNKYSIAEIKEIESKLYSKLLKNLIVSAKINLANSTSSKLINNITELLYLDLYTTFKANDELSNLIDKYITSSLFNIANVDSKLDICISKLNDFDEILKTKGNPILKTESFRMNSSFEVDENLYQERYGEQISKNRHLNYDYKNNRLTLPLLFKTNTLMNENCIKFADIKIKKKSCENFIVSSTETDINKIIDTSSKNYWKENIYTDSEIKINYSNIKPSDPKLLSNYYYNIKNGYLLELEIIYESVCVVNNIEINPCTKYPMKLIAIRYTDTDDISDLKELVYPDNSNEYLKEKIMNNAVNYDFQDITCKRVYLVFNQINYEKRNFIINTTDIIKDKIWLDVIKDTNNNEIYKNIDIVFKPNYLDKKIKTNYFNKLNNFATNSNNLELHNLFYNSTPSYKNLYKNCYEIGFYNISTLYYNYDKFGVYVSNKIKINKNIKSISIQTNETHYKTSNEFIESDIEYYISTSDKPAHNEWIPIFPTNKDYIHSELLQLGTDYCELRFLATEVYSIYMNEILLKENVDYFVHYCNENIKYVEIPNFNHNSIYKACYKPYDKAYNVNLLDTNIVSKISTTTEIIEGNNSYVYKLSNVPYIDSENITYIRMINVNNGQTNFDQDTNIYCCTDIAESNKSYKNFFDSQKIVYQYYTHGNELIFNKPIPQDYRIEIMYKYYPSEFRLKAIMRRNNNKDVWLSPILNKIEYSITTV